MATIGPLVFYALWPWMWNDTFPRLQEYFNFHLHHEYYNIEYLHKNYWSPPSPKSYAPVMIFATVPGVTLLLFLVGAFDRIKNGALRIWAFVAPMIKRAGVAPRRSRATWCSHAATATVQGRSVRAPHATSRMAAGSRTSSGMGIALGASGLPDSAMSRSTR